MELDIWQLTTLVRSTAEEAVRQYRIAIDPSSDEITQREAARIYGVGWLKSQCARGMITWSRAGTAPNSKKIFSRKRLEELKNGDIDPILKKAFGRIGCQEKNYGREKEKSVSKDSGRIK